MVPKTTLGRVLALACVSFGIILNGMPISVIYNKFSDDYAKLNSYEGSATYQAHGEVRLVRRAARRVALCCQAAEETSTLPA